MGTAYNEIYERFYDKMTDYNLLKIGEAYLEQTLRSYLHSAVRDVKHWCRITLTEDNTTQSFAEDLDTDLQDVLAVGMASYWLNPKVANSDNLHNVMNTKDFSQFSPAELLLRMKELKTELRKDFRRSAIDYTFREGWKDE